MTPAASPSDKPVVRTRVPWRPPRLLSENHIAHVAFWILIPSLVALGALGAWAHGLVTDVRSLKEGEYVQSAERIARRFSQLQEDLRATKDLLRRLPEIRPTREELVRVIQTLEALAQRTGVQQSVAVVPREKDRRGQPYASPVIRYAVTLDGPLPTLVAYVAALHESPQLFLVEELVMKPNLESPPVGQWQATAEIAVAIRDDN